MVRILGTSSPSIADGFKLRVDLNNKSSTNADLVFFSDEFKSTTISRGTPYVIDLKKSDLISEKTIKAIQPGESPRGWILFKLPGIPANQYAETNVVLTFSDINGKQYSVTNGFWRGKLSKEIKNAEATESLPGSESIMNPIINIIQSNTPGWLPPELPPGCSNVTIFFGSQGFTYSKYEAEISPESSGTKFAISELPDQFTANLDKTPNYSPRMKNLWLRQAGVIERFGEINVEYPILPFIISNRLYVEVEIPFLNKKRKIVMSDDFDSELPIPNRWDRNYSTNQYYYVYEIVNEQTNPVLQVFYTAPNEIHINGIFIVNTNLLLASFGGPPTLFNFGVGTFQSTNDITNATLKNLIFHESIPLNSNTTSSEFNLLISNALYHPTFPGQKPIFKYPSNRGNLGVFDVKLTK